ncbi:hypothetical protein ACIB24_13425 [Spongisporangium articulatum]|uniref:Uncharacterized protein n=1 Tax=Spongisporangium articulatum TaxID=3362603 RepID=A0ABW8AR01_9ACTN
MDERPNWWLLMGLTVLFILAAVTQCGGARNDPDKSDGIVRGGGPAPSATSVVRRDEFPPAAPTSTEPSGATPKAGDPGTLVASPDDVVIPRRFATKVDSNGSLKGYAGQRATGTDLLVKSVPADEGFWVVDPDDPDSEPVWVQLLPPPPESPYDVDQGDTVSFTGTFVTDGPGFPDEVGVTDSEGKAMLLRQGAHVDVDMQALDLDPLIPG